IVGVVDDVTVAPGVPTTATQLENSDVLPEGSVAVAVMKWPPGTEASGRLMLASPIGSVPCIAEPRKLCPSPHPDGSQTALSKNSRKKVVMARLLNVPTTVVLTPSELAAVSTG